jgi:hypothetical protein
MSSWPLSSPFVSAPASDPSRSIYIGTSTGNILPVPTVGYSFRYDKGGALSCNAIDAGGLAMLSGIILLNQLNVNVPGSYTTPYTFRDS